MFFLDFVFLACTMPYLKHIRDRPGDKNCLLNYLRLLCLWYLRVTLQAFPPFGKTCEKRKEVFQAFQECVRVDPTMPFKSGVLNAVRNMNCTPMGHSQVQLLMTWILLSPMFLPTTQLMWYNIMYVLTIQFPAMVAYRRMLGEMVYLKRDMSGTVCLLSFVSLIAAGRKYYMVRNEESMARSDREAKEVTQKLYDILKFMVPQHVIERLLCGEVVADPLERVSILFVIIVDFDEHVKRLQPEELVEFLNDNFTAWDDICYNDWVTKIETVGEEYVCAVGVSPKDQRENDRHGHKRPLTRLLRAALRILAMHNENVKLKMGMHTGPIVAGVLGEAKLPRFRLFGDTINTSARMMQKGQPGKLQFGEETYKDVAKLCREDLMTAKVQEKNGIAPGKLVQDNGHVEMKGKGMVRTFLVEPREMVRVPRASADASNEGEFRRSLLGASAFEEDAFTATTSTRTRERSNQRDARRPQPDGDLPKGWHQALPEVITARGYQAASSSAATARTPLQNTFAIEEAVVARDVTGAADDDGDSDDADRGGLEATLAAVNDARKGENYNCWIQLTSFGLRSSFFTDDSREREFRKWFHEEIVCHKLESRLHKQAVMLIALSGLEIIYFELLKVLGRGNDEEDELMHWLEKNLPEGWDDGVEAGVMRLPIFISCRFLAYFIIISWQGVARVSESYARRVLPQTALMISYCLVAFLFFISYDAITSVNNSDIDEHATKYELNKMMLAHTRDSSINSLIFFPIYVLIISQIKCRFQYTICFVGLSYLLMRLSKQKGWFNLFFSMSGRSYFIGVSCFYASCAWKEEFIHRRRFKAKTYIKESKESIDRMLSKLMPEDVLEEIKRKEELGDPKPPSHFYRHATIAQSDLVGFTALASTRSPDQVVSLISELFGMFDEKADLYTIYKVETVGDAYIAGQADPPLTRENKPANVARFGLAMIEATKQWGQLHGLDVSCRVGLHTGQCYGGIVGNDMRRYHLFGDLMTALEVLESTAPKGCVQVSPGWKKAFEKSATVEDKLELRITEREGEKLTTSKGEEHSYDEVGGRTFIIHPDPDS